MEKICGGFTYAIPVVGALMNFSLFAQNTINLTQITKPDLSNNVTKKGCSR
jgi:hypothetical protein